MYDLLSVLNNTQHGIFNTMEFENFDYYFYKYAVSEDQHDIINLLHYKVTLKTAQVITNERTEN